MKSDNDKFIGLLMDLGLSRNEAETYIVLQRLDSTSIRKIASETGINRGTTYEALKRLTEIGLVSVRQNGKREQYTAESPEKIFDIIRDKRHELLDASETAKSIIPDILARRASIEGRPLVKYYEGETGLATILRDVLQTCRDQRHPGYYAYSSRLVRQYLYRKFPGFTDKRIAEGIEVKVIAVGAGGDETPKSARKWLSEPADGQGISSYTIIYGPKVATISIAADNTPYGVIVEDLGAAGMQRLLFERLWETLPDEKRPEASPHSTKRHMAIPSPAATPVE